MQTIKRVLVTDYVHDKLITGLREMGYEVQYDQHFPPEQLEYILPHLHGIIVNTKSAMTRKRIELGEQLEFIARLGSGLDIIDLEAAAERNIKVISTPEGNCDSVAEHAIGMILCLTNKLTIADAEVRDKIWNREANRGHEMMGKTIGIVGMGNTGKAMARKLSCWGLNIIYSDPYVLELPKEYSYLSRVDFKDLVQQADIVSFHVQLTKETYHMADTSFFENCKNGLIIVNTSRGAVVDTEALVRALKSRKIKGACLDVFENEKPHSFKPQEDQLYESLYSMKNVVLSPHIAGWTHESLERIADVLLRKLNV